MDEATVKRLISEQLLKANLSDHEMIARSKEAAQFAYEGASSAEVRSAEVSTEFIRLEVNIATLLFIFVGLFVGAFVTPDSALNDFWVKVAFSGGILALLISLLMGLLHLRLMEGYWDDLLNQRYLRYLQWEKAASKEVSFQEAKAFHEGTAIGKGKIVWAPSWAWIMQSIFLGIGILTLFILFVAFMFTANSVATSDTAGVATTTVPMLQ